VVVGCVSLYVSYSVDKVKNVSKFQDAYKDFEGKIKLAETNLIKINETARHISGATALTAYANGFDNQAKEHEDSAFKWLVLMILSVILFALFVGCLLFFNLGEFNFIKDIFADDVNYRDKLVLTSLALKAAFIFAYIQVIKFISRNYNAHKHLQEVYLHRRNVLQTLHAVYEAIGEGDEKNKILYAGAITAFDRGETGYITTKEGAGSDDGLMQILLSKLK
jgi:predicted small secreted protein